MQYGICNLSIVPLRAESSTIGKMLSQVLYGEVFNPHYSSSGQIIFQIILKFHTYEISIDS